ncbi:MAG TPA: NAD(P)H-hydrate dehydratase [Pelolinea sp.]|nr:NAD(P)H-hydrate dehydratase [Pelolinea sp.]
MRIVTVAQMVQLEKEANQGGLTYEQMMTNAGKGLAEVVHREYFYQKRQAVLGLVGGGNNGGDTLVALTHLVELGWSTRAYFVKERSQKDPLVKAYLAQGGEIIAAMEDKGYSQLKKIAKDAEVILDGILGTGISLPLHGRIPDVLKAVGQAKKGALVVAVDCPSGVDCDSGEAAVGCLKADLTVSLAAVKQGLLKFPAFKYTGRIITVDIGLTHSLSGWKAVRGDVLSADDVASLLPLRDIDSHKGSFGTALIVAGSVNYCGAALLSVWGAYRVGVGLVRLAIPGAIYDALAGQLPEATWLVLPHTDGVINGEGANLISRNLKSVTSLLIGPGFGIENDTREFLAKLLEKTKIKQSGKKSIGFTGNSLNSSGEESFHLPPTVVDADGLKLLAQIKDWPSKLIGPAVITPHPGEMSILTGKPVNEIQQNRIEVACEYAKKWGHIIVLKGALTVVSEPGGKYTVIPIASSALATAGTGDVLAGMIAGLIAQGLAAYSAASAGAWLHAQAGLIAAERLGSAGSVIAGDVVDAIPFALKSTTGILK